MPESQGISSDFISPKVKMEISLLKRSPNSSSGLDYDYVDEFDQQGLAAQARPVVVKPTKATEAAEEKSAESPSPPSESTKVYTLYFSGKTPGEYTTRLTTVTVGEGSELPGRRRRHAEEREGGSIEPTRVRPILMTEPPSHKQACCVLHLTLPKNSVLFRTD